jgi:glutamate-1-semialdehyde 2,1-aminomutase
MNVVTAPERMGTHDLLSAGMLPEAVAQTLILPFNDLESVASTIRKRPGEIAAVILEMIPHNIGSVLPTDDFLVGLREVTREHGIVLIFDEVVTGFRHALGGYQSIRGVTPDLTTLAKAMANGFPIGALVGQRSLMRRCAPPPAGDVFSAGTFNAHAMGMAAGLATVEELERPGVYQDLFARGEAIRQGLAAMIDRFGIRAQVAGFGSVWLVYFLEGEVRSYGDLLRNDSAADVAFRWGLVRRGVFSVPIPLKRNHLTVSHTDEHVALTLQAAEDVLGRIAAGQSTA